MTTEGVIELQRDVNVLLGLGTYQGMTDAEIQSIIDFYVDDAKSETRSSMKLDAQFVAECQLRDAYTAYVEASAGVLQSMLEIQIPWVTVGGDS